MKKALFVILTVSSVTAMADNYVNGYVRQDGTYVQPHYQTAPDRNPYNNYTTQGNTNPYTGQQGTRNPYQVQQEYAPQRQQQPSYNYGSQPRRSNNW